MVVIVGEWDVLFESVRSCGHKDMTSSVGNVLVLIVSAGLVVIYFVVFPLIWAARL